MKIAIIEDSKEDTLHLLNLLNTYFLKYDFAPCIDTFLSAEQFLSDFETETYDLCFIDIYLPGITGIDMAMQIYKMDPACTLIFISSGDQYIGDGYRVRALRYLLKPITMQQLNDVLPEYMENSILCKRRLTIQINRKDREVPFSKIFYVTSSVKTELHFRTVTYPLTSKKSFSDITAPLLTDYRFITCSRGIVVNMSHVRKIDGDCFLMENGDKVPISRRRFSDVSNTFMDFQFEHLL